MSNRHRILSAAFLSALAASSWLFPPRAAAGGTGQLVIVSTPPGAVITIDGTRAGKTPLTRAHLLPGDHVVDASWPDGSSASTVAHVDSGASAVLKLAPPEVETGQLDIMTVPAGASVSVDGRPPSGVAPLTVRGLSVGAHAIVASFSDGRTATATATVAANRSALVKLEEAVATTGTLVVVTEPPGAQVTLDGRPLGNAPVVELRDVPVGPHQLSAEWPDGRALKQATKVVGGVSTAARLAAPALPTGDLEVTTMPPGAHVDVDGKSQPTLAPLTAHQLAVGSHLVVATWPDGRTARATVTVLRDTAVGAHLAPPATLWGNLDVATQPPGARILVDGNAQPGTAPMLLRQVANGTHTLVAEWPDGRAATMQAIIATGATTRARLAAPPPPPPAPPTAPPVAPPAAPSVATGAR